MNDAECAEYIKSENFKNKFNEIFIHDKEIFDEPTGWRTKSITESPLISDFDNLWKQLKAIYKTELSALAFEEIPNEDKIVEQFKKLIAFIK